MLIAAAFLASPQIWTVDDDAPGDFATLAQAFGGVSPGDTLLVMPGTYAAEPLTIDLQIFGPSAGPAPLITGTFDVQGVSSFTLGGLAIERLSVRGVSGRGRIDDCTIGAGIGAGGGEVPPSLEIIQSHVIEVLRTESTGRKSAGGFYAVGGAGIGMSAATVEIVDGVFVGGDASGGAGAIFAGPGIGLDDGSSARISGSSARGGEGFGSPFLIGPTGYGGHGIRTWGSQVDLRGSSSDVIAGGWGDISQESAISVSGGTLSWSGVTQAGGIEYPLFELDPPAPYLVIDGPDAPGTAKRVKLYGQAGQPAVLALAVAPAYFAVPGVPGGAFGLDPSALLALHATVTLGQDVEVNWLLSIPPNASLVGVAALVQGAVHLTPPGWWLTNFGAIAPRY